jgi:uncharacterized membrane protein
MHWYPIIKLLHIIAVIVALGGIFARQLLRRYAEKAHDIRTFAEFSRAAGQIEQVMVVPGMNAVLVLGVILALIGGLPILGFLQGASENWLLVSNVLLLSIVVVVSTVFVPRGKKYAPILDAALSKGEITPELRAALGDRIVRLAHWYEEFAVLAIAALMVLKPF